MTDDDRRTEFRVSRTKLQHGMLLAGFLGLIGVYFLVTNGPDTPSAGWAGAINLVLAAAVAISVYVIAHDRRPRMVIDAQGLWYRDWSLPPIPWNAIDAVGFRGARMQSFIEIDLRDAKALINALPDGQRRRLRGNRLVQPPHLIIQNGALDAPLDEIHAAIVEWLPPTPRHAVNRDHAAPR